MKAKKTPQTRSKRTAGKSRAKPMRGGVGRPRAPSSKSSSAKTRSRASIAKLAAALKRAEAAVAKLKRKGRASAKMAAAQAKQLKKLRAATTKGRGTASNRKRATQLANAAASKARHAASVAPDKSTRLGEARSYEGPEVALPERAFAEGRLFRSGATLLGYLEGRPGIMAIRTVTPLHPPVGSEATPNERERTADVAARIDAIVDDIAGTGDDEDEGDPGNLEELLWEAYWDAEDFGVMVEADIDSDSGDPS